MRGGVVVTGASTGIGRETARTLAAHGFHVFGTVRRSADADTLRAEGVTPVLMDVTDGASIAAGRQTVRTAPGEPPRGGGRGGAGRGGAAAGGGGEQRRRAGGRSPGVSPVGSATPRARGQRDRGRGRHPGLPARSAP